MQAAQVVAQVLRQAQDDVAVEAWADRSAEHRDVAALVAEVFPPAPFEIVKSDQACSLHVACHALFALQAGYVETAVMCTRI